MKVLMQPWMLGPFTLAVMLAQPACSSMIEPAATSAPAQPATSAPASAEDNPMKEMLQQIRADAARRTGAPADSAKVLSVEAVTWSDGSLGCPEPGKLYTQALVRGHRIRVEAGGAVLDYHANALGAFIQCPPERALDPAPGDPI